MFGYYNLSYPTDIYGYKDSTLFQFDDRFIEIGKEEVGGVINYSKDIEIQFLFSGTSNRILLEYPNSAHTIFHTHTNDHLYDPPSILDIVAFLSLTIKNLANMILGDKIFVQNSIVFSKHGTYVYYISEPLMNTIYQTLLKMFRKPNFVHNVEKLIDELDYSHLEKFSGTLDENCLNKYIKAVNSIGIIMKRFSSFPQVYVIT